MKNRIRKNSKIGKLCLIGFLWWALFYPDLYLVEDDCLVVECENDQETELEDDLFEQLENTEKLQIKCKWLEWIIARYKEL